MADLYVMIAGIFGLLIGSFLNVCISRIPRDMSVVSPRSFCVECGSQIAWYDNIPLFSYVALRGHCRTCGRAIGIRHVIVELATCLLFAACVWRYGITLEALKWMVFEVILLVLFWTDIEERILPDEFTLGGLAAAFVFAVFIPVHSFFGDFLLASWSYWAKSLANAAVGALIVTVPIWMLSYVYGLIIKRETLGLGDVKLLLMMGAFLGPENQLSACLIGAVTGAVVGVAYLVWKRKHFRSYELPFGSFLCLGGICVALMFELAPAI